MNQDREIIFYKKYFIEFYLELATKVQEKIEYVFKIVKTVENIPIKYLKFVEGTKGLYEIRIEYESNIYRIFCCFDEGRIIVLFNGFQKKTQKTPSKEIDLAKKILKEYLEIKNK